MASQSDVFVLVIVGAVVPDCVAVTNFPSVKKNAVEGNELGTNSVHPLSADVLLLSVTPKRKSLALLVVQEHWPKTALGMAALGSFGEAV
jgi:hypothetical protein